MRVGRQSWTKNEGWQGEAPANSQWVLFFGSPDVLDDARYAELREQFPRALLLGCTTAGEIGAEATEGTISVMGVELDASLARGAQESIDDTIGARAVGERIGQKLADRDLRAIFVLSDGASIDGSELVDGLCSAVGRGVHVSGGLAGDGPRASATRVGLDGPPRERMVCAVGLYGRRLSVASAAAGGWSPFGPKVLVTSSGGNVLRELDGHAALDCYKQQLQQDSGAFLYPLVVERRTGQRVVRRVVDIDEETKTMTFAGDVPEGSIAQLMRTSASDLVDGAATAAAAARTAAGSGFAVLVSCAGRRKLLGSRSGDEVAAARAVLGSEFPTVGFYSHGEIAPRSVGGASDLHNHTMTITTFSEW
jgi:hypothetical protein